MDDKKEKHQQIQDKLLGLWQNLQSNFLWDFREADDEGSRLLIVMDEKTPFPNTWCPHYSVTYNSENSIFLDLWDKDSVTMYRIVFLSEKHLIINNPPFDKPKDPSNSTITLVKV